MTDASASVSNSPERDTGTSSEDEATAALKTPAATAKRKAALHAAFGQILRSKVASHMQCFDSMCTIYVDLCTGWNQARRVLTLSRIQCRYVT